MLSSNTLKAIAFTLLFFATSSLSAQNKIKYSYDAAGNRLTREVVIESQKAPENRQRAQKGRTGTFPDDRYKADITMDKEGICIVASISGIATGDRCHIEMYSAQGALVMRRDAGNGSTMLDIAGMQTGVYLLKITINDNCKTWKITNK